MSDPVVLIVDDEPFPRRFLQMILEPRGYRVITASNAEQATERVREVPVDLIFLDIKMPGEDGLSWLGRLDEVLVAPEEQRPEVVVITGHGTVTSAVQAMKLGAADFLEKPFDSPEAVGLVVDRVLHRRRLSEENRRLRAQLRQRFGAILGQSFAMQSLYEIIERVAPLPITALLLGESGTGKELVARTLHDRSPRAKGPFVAVNCAGLPETLLESAIFGHERGAFTGADRARKGYFEEAQGGTLFLDEVGDMSSALQSRLLRVIQEKRFNRVGGVRELVADVRLLAATHQDLPRLVREGIFREDLYYRLKVVEIQIPPLRDRDGDIELLANSFLKHAAERFGRGELKMTPHLVAALQGHDWRGNVRELKHVMERIAALAISEELGPEALPPGFGSSERASGASQGNQNMARFAAMSLNDARGEFEVLYLRAVLERTSGNVSRAADVAGIARQHLHRKLKRYNIQPSDYKPS